MTFIDAPAYAGSLRTPARLESSPHSSSGGSQEPSNAIPLNRHCALVRSLGGRACSGSLLTARRILWFQVWVRKALSSAAHGSGLPSALKSSAGSRNGGGRLAAWNVEGPAEMSRDLDVVRDTVVGLENSSGSSVFCSTGTAVSRRVRRRVLEPRPGMIDVKS